ncbi:MAG TPA: hypothetical protein VHO70_18300 [Chitinispirillaceae bacterium]|nr:hypothetical protein [Chitinispirillaceae bacterium]
MNVQRFVFAIITSIAFTLFAQDEDLFDLNEDEMFADTSRMTDSATVVKSGSSFGNIDSTNVSFSGQISSSAGGTLNNDFFDQIDRDEIDPFASTIGNLMLDARLPLGIKAYANSEFTWLADSNKAFFQLQEAFVDVNVAKKAYFRVGKQVLQWGRGEIWNPTDLVNVEKKPIQKDLGSREGSYGIKMHLPFGTRWNVYGFVDLNNVTAIDSVAGTMKLETLIGGTEIAVALWKKSRKDPVFGLDFSTSLLDFSLTGEVSLTSGDNYDIPTGLLPGGYLKVGHPKDDVVARACIGLTRFIDLLGIDDRMVVHGEYYYNQAGIDGNVIKDYGIGDSIHAIKVNSRNGLKSVSPLAGQIINLYEPNSHSRHYAALSASISKFIISDITLNLMGLVNMNHGCAMLISGLNYQNMYNYSLGMEFTAYVGGDNTEYTFMGNRMSLNLYTGIAF